MQPFDLTTLRAVQQDLASQWLPARIETVQQLDLWTLCLCLRTLQTRRWLLLSWHPQAGRIHLCQPPPKAPDPFQFSQSIGRQLKGLALTEVRLVDPWERVLDLHFAPRPGDPPLWHFYLEIMGRYSNGVVVEATSGDIYACGHGVSERQSSVRPVQPGLSYQLPPPLTDPMPKREESFVAWQERVALIPEQLERRLLKSYRGVSKTLTQSMLRQAGIPLQATVPEVSGSQWHQLYAAWQDWLQVLQEGSFKPVLTPTGYSLLGWDPDPEQPDPSSVHDLLDSYYSHHLNRATFHQEHQRLAQKLKVWLQKLYQRRQGFQATLDQSDKAEEAKQKADLLMAHLQSWQPGMTELLLPDFETGDPVRIPLEPEKNAIANAQTYYKKHRKQKRSRNAVWPLFQTTDQEIRYLEQVESALWDLDVYRQPSDLQTLDQIRQELIQQKYPLEAAGSEKALPKAEALSPFRCYHSPSGYEIWVGRNNHQNDELTFKLAQEQDWWLHAQEIPGSHVLLRLPPGGVAEDEDLQRAADLAAHFSRARQSEQVPVVYTRPKHVRKPNRTPPGMVVYSQEKVIWAQPQKPALLSLLAEGDS